MVTFILKGYFALFVFVSAFGIFVGCSDSESSNTEQLDSETFDTYASICSQYFDLLQASGIGIDSTNGIFSIGWNQFLNLMVGDTVAHGHAFAVAFNEIGGAIPPHFKEGVDMGSVSINYQSNHIELQKIEDPFGGVLYSLFPRFNSDDKLEFIPNEVYEFEISGSSSFAPANISLTALSGLLEFTSHANNDIIDPNNDLDLTWSGGTTNVPVVIHILPEIQFQPVNGGGIIRQFPGGNFGNMGPGFHNGHPRIGPHLLPMPMPIQIGIFEVLQDNPGQYTVKAANLQNLLNNTEATGIICHVSQMNGNEIDHEGSLLRAVMRNGDQLMLSVQ